MHLSHLVLLAGVLGAAAHPSGHAHRSVHESLHEARGRGTKTFYKNIHHQHIPKPKPKPSVSSSASAAVASPSKAPSGPAKYKPFCSRGGGSASKKEKRVTVAQVFYTGNLGDDDNCPWGSNMIEISESIADMYDYVQKFTNRASETYQVRCGNKMGRDRQVTGMFSAMGDGHLIFNVGPGETKYMAIQGNSQIICAFAPGSVPLTPFGQYAGNWAESDFGNESNKKWSGSDCSALVAQHYNMAVPGCKICQGGVCSTIWPNGKGDNAYTRGMEELDGIGLNIPPGKTCLDIEIGIQ